MAKNGVALLFVALLLIHPLTSVSHLSMDSIRNSARNSGIDLSVIDVSIEYSNPSDESQYKMFSSNHPIIGFDRPESMYAVDTVNATPMDIEVTVRNDGNTASGIITLALLILHDEYERFELANRTITMNSLSANGQATATFSNVYVNYSGNHSLQITPSFQGVDDNPSNDVFNRHYTVANIYFTCTSLSGWNVGQYWGTSTDTSVSMGESCHIGQGQFGSYANNLQTDLMTPIWDLSDAIANPTRANGITFFFTGSANQNDGLKVYAFDRQGGWDELASIAGSAGSSLSNWRTSFTTHMGHTTPIMPASPSEHFHSNSRFKFSFFSDSTGTDVGYWFDEFILLYDQSARSEEYNLDVSGVFTDGSIPGSWGKIRMELSNTGNISDVLVPSIPNLPTDWNVSYSYPNGAGVNLNAGIRLLPGESKQIDVRIQPDMNANVGFVPLTFVVNSLQNPSFSVQEGMQYQVSADRIPFIHNPETKPKCAPGSSCVFFIDVENIGQATDVFDLETAAKSLDQGWSVNLAFDQPTSVRLVPNQVQAIKFVMTVPSGETPERTGDFWLTMTAQNDSSRTLTESIIVQASMISNALIDLDIMSTEISMISAGEVVHIDYTITNQATRQDSFELTVEYAQAIGWIIEAEQRPSIVINPGASTSFYIAVTAPENAQANDFAPTIKPILTSTRSGMQYEGPEYSNIVVETLYDVSLEITEMESVLKPGGTTTFELELTNNGNGPTTASIHLVDSPDSWSYSIRLNGVIQETTSVNLGMIYTGDTSAKLEFLLYVPMTEAANEFHTVTFDVQAEGSDIHPIDNQKSVEMITGSIKYPEYNSSSKDYHAMIGSTVRLNGSVTNVGNALESSMDIGFELSTSPPTNGVIGFLTAGVGGPTSESGEVLTIPMSAGSSKLILMDLIIGEDVPLNTRVVVTVFVEGGMNTDGELVRIEHQNLIMVDQQRKIVLDVSPQSNNSELAMNELWLNMTSFSTQSEELNYSIMYPDGWQVTCDGTLVVNKEENKINLPYERNQDAIKDIQCVIQRLEGSYLGEVVVSASALDGTIEFSEKRTFEFLKPEQEESFFSKNMNAPTIIASVFGLLILAAILLVLRRQKPVEIEDETFVSGPPISQQPIANAGPPASTAVAQPTLSNNAPPLPVDGLPDGWSMEQWTHYGQQYLDRLAKQP